MKYKEFYTVLPVKDNAPHILQGVVQYDTANVVNCTLMMGDDPFDFSGYTDIVLNILKPDGTRIMSVVTSDEEYNVDNPYTIRAIKPEDGTLSFTLQGQATVITGTYFAQITLLSDGVLMSSVRINYDVQVGMNDVDTDKFSGDDYSGIRNVLAKWSLLNSNENERRAAENERKSRDDARSAAEAAREARMATLEQLIRDYLRVADEYVDQTEANKDACRAYAALAAQPSAEILRTILESMNVADKDYVDAQDTAYNESEIDGNKRTIKVKRTNEAGDIKYYVMPYSKPQGETFFIRVEDHKKFHNFIMSCLSECDEDTDVIYGMWFVYLYDTDTWKFVMLSHENYTSPDYLDDSKTFDFTSFEDIGLYTSGSHVEDVPAGTQNTHYVAALYASAGGYVYKARADINNTGNAVLEVGNAIGASNYGHFALPYILGDTIEYMGQEDGKHVFNAYALKYNGGQDGLTFVRKNSSMSILIDGFNITSGTPAVGDKWYIYPEVPVSTTRGEITLDGDYDMYVGLGDGESLNVTKVYYAGANPPDNTNLLWIDTGHNSIMKYWNGSQWVVTNQALFA